MIGRRFRRRPPAELAGVAAGFEASLVRVEQAKTELVGAVPTGRGGLPLAEALAGFEALLSEAREGMPAWRVPSVEAEWAACRAAIDEAAERAERLRLDQTPRGYEELYGTLADILEPLDAFARARDRFVDRGP
jgi:hypothetical protein